MSGDSLYSKTHTWSLSKGDEVFFQVFFRVHPSLGFEHEVIRKDCFVLVHEHGGHAYWRLIYKVSLISNGVIVSSTHVGRNHPFSIIHLCL